MAVGVDFTPAMLAQAAARRATLGPGSARPFLVAADAARLPLASACFDVVTCRFSVHHMSDPQTGLTAMATTLKLGGRLVIADFVRPDDAGEAERHDRLERLRGHQHVQIYEAARLEAMLAAAGCPVQARREAIREMNPRDFLTSPNVAPENRNALAALVAEVEAGSGAGFEAQRVDGEPRLVRRDLVLLGIKR
jgi:ubiquinone/menaquinone biosynthesis C-methylase UbiE